MLSACPCFQSGETEWTEGGTNRHRYLHILHLLTLRKGEPGFEPDQWGLENEQFELAEKMSEEEIDACIWAHDYIKMTAPYPEHPIYFERKMSAMLPNFDDIEGTPDVVCGRDLFDLKWRERDYSAQMAAYALMMFESDATLEQVRVHILFGAFKKVQPPYFLTREDAERKVMHTIAGTEPAIPKACDYCGWCKNKLVCPAIVNPVAQVAVGFSGGKPPEITTWIPSEIQTDEQLGFALTMCRSIVKKWCSQLEIYALECATKKGWSIPGFELKETTGRKYITDIKTAFALTGVSQDEFFECCEPRLETSKKYPDKKGLVQVYQRQSGLKNAAAKRALLEKLSAVIKPGANSQKLKSVNDNDDDEN